MNNAKKLRKVLSEGFQMIPGTFNAFSMGLVEQTGFKAGYLGGYSLAASSTRTPDWGLITQTEMLDAAVNTVNAVDIPIICDIDQGFGALSNFLRTIWAYENAGVAGVHFEDQYFPKKCGGMTGRPVIPIEDNVKKIKAALEIRNDPDFVIITRTDSGETEGLDGVLRRFDAYFKAGADYGIFFEAPKEEDFVKVGKEFPGKVIVFIGDLLLPDSPPEHHFLPFKAYAEMGYAAAINCVAAFGAAHQAVKKVYKFMMDNGQITREFYKENCGNFVENNKVLKIDYWQNMREKYEML